MIIRILGEGQLAVDAADAESFNELDRAVEQAVEAGDQEAFETSLAALLDAVRSVGVAVPDEELVESELILPPSDSSLEEVAELLGDDGLIPG